ncbi:MAG: MFS transporter [Acidobacteria bacterium]|nr:MFS transporter [Acidobacteriota bacterium]MBV9623961.1 MFS transporter [Acidobacteriota bacterium]
MSVGQNDSRHAARFAPALLLLALSFVINYIDRGNISVAAPLLKTELHLSASQLGILFAAFFSTYTAMQFVVGWVVDRFDANRVLAAGFLLWSMATAATGMVRGFALLLAMRFTLGIGESVAMPSGSKILACNLPEHRRGFASGAMMAALRCGNAIGTLGAGLLMARFGWRPVFITIGLASLLWLPAWAKWMPRGNRELKTALGSKPGLPTILRQRSFWGTSAGHFSANYLFYFMITWLPSYLVFERHLSMASMSAVAGLYYSVDSGSAIAAGWLQDVSIRHGYSPTLVRKSAMAVGFSLAAIAIVGCAASSHSYLPWLLTAGLGCGMTGPGLFTFPQTLAGADAVGRWYGWQNGFANFAGILGPVLTGFVVERTGNFLGAFVITAALCVAGVVAWVFVVGRVEQVRWKTRHDAEILSANAQA